MTVAELIKDLQKCPPDSLVLLLLNSARFPTATAYDFWTGDFKIEVCSETNATWLVDSINK